jgi:hypothetical protein
MLLIEKNYIILASDNMDVMETGDNELGRGLTDPRN